MAPPNDTQRGLKRLWAAPYNILMSVWGQIHLGRAGLGSHRAFWTQTASMGTRAVACHSRGDKTTELGSLYSAHPTTLQGQAESVHPALVLVITIGAATHHHLQCRAAVGRGSVGGPWAPKASRPIAAVGRVGSHTTPASRSLAQHRGGGELSPSSRPTQVMRAWRCLVSSALAAPAVHPSPGAAHAALQPGHPAGPALPASHVALWPGCIFHILPHSESSTPLLPKPVPVPGCAGSLCWLQWP